MKTAILAVTLLALSSPSYAQFGGVLDRAKQVKDTKDKIDELNITDEEERKIGEDVSVKVRARFGVVQDPAITKYVTLVGTVLARQSERARRCSGRSSSSTPTASTRSRRRAASSTSRAARSGLISNEAELAGVLAHEIGHVAHKHTVNAIRKNKAVQIGTNATLADRGPFLDQHREQGLRDGAREHVRSRRRARRRQGVGHADTKKVGYAPRHAGRRS